MFGDGMIPLPHIYGARMKGVEVFCPLDPPPPYEAVASQPAAQVLIYAVIICYLLSHNYLCNENQHQLAFTVFCPDTISTLFVN